MTRKILTLCMVVFAAAIVAGCSEGNNNNPVAPADQSSSLTSAASGVRNNSYPVLLCHANPDGDDGDPLWVVIEVDNNSRKYNGHLRHGDLTTCSYGPSLSTYEVGDDCCVCATGSACGGDI